MIEFLHSGIYKVYLNLSYLILSFFSHYLFSSCHELKFFFQWLSFHRLHPFLWIIFFPQCLQTKDAAQYKEHASTSIAQQSLAGWTAWQGSARHHSSPTPTRSHWPSPLLDLGDEERLWAHFEPMWALSDSGQWRWGSFSMGHQYDSSVLNTHLLSLLWKAFLCAAECLILNLRDEHPFCLFFVLSENLSKSPSNVNLSKGGKKHVSQK